MMQPIRIDCPSVIPARVLTAAAVLALVAWYAYGMARFNFALGTVAVLGAVLLALFLHFRRHPDSIELAPETDELIVHYKAWVVKPSHRYVLSEFKRVRSYSRVGSALGVTVVELATDEPLPRAIRIATLGVGDSKEGHFFGNARSVEVPKAAAIRAQLAATQLFHDEGFRAEFLERRAQDVV